MTTFARLYWMLIDLGLFAYDAEQIMKEFKEQANKIVPEYNITWDRPAEEYPDTVYRAFRPYLYKLAKEYIELNRPKAWFLPALRELVE